MNWDDTTDTSAERLVGASADLEGQDVEAAMRR
jgi:Holliday junction DNA helicase RuvB